MFRKITLLYRLEDGVNEIFFIIQYILYYIYITILLIKNSNFIIIYYAKINM